MLDEYYLCGEELSRESCKEQVKIRSKIDRFAKPRKGKSGIYAILMDSDKYFYDRFYKEIDTYCFECGKHIHGKECMFPKTNPGCYDENYSDYGYIYYCSDDCKYTSTQKMRGAEGEWQGREGYDTNGGIYGYIYHIYNRVEDKHYIGQTRYMPFFRWQEHAKQNIKGDICDLVFNTICEVRVKSQAYLNDIEAWWIQKYIDDYGKDNVMNLTNPKFSIPDLIEHYEKIHSK